PGASHMGLSVCSLMDGYLETHMHSYEESFYILEGRPVLHLDGQAIELKPGACGVAPVGVPHAWRGAGRALWVEMVAPRPRPDGSDTFFLGPAPEGPGVTIDVRDPRNRHLFLLTEGEMDPNRLKRGAAVTAPTLSASMAT